MLGTSAIIFSKYWLNKNSGDCLIPAYWLLTDRIFYMRYNVYTAKKLPHLV